MFMQTFSGSAYASFMGLNKAHLVGFPYTWDKEARVEETR